MNKKININTWRTDSKVKTTTMKPDKCEDCLVETSFLQQSKPSAKFKWLCSECASDRNRLKNYGIDREEYDRLRLEQKYCCAICGTHESLCYLPYKDVRNKRCGLFVDHDHKTNKVRGLVCSHCNTILGSAKDSVNILINATEYLMKHSMRHGSSLDLKNIPIVERVEQGE